MKRNNYTLPPTYNLSDPGCGSAGEPPDHPRHYVRAIYTRHGFSPGKGPCYYLNGNGYDDLSEIDSLYQPLPLESERVQLWIQAQFAHHHHCYQDPNRTKKWDDPIIYPVPNWRLRQFQDDPRFSDEWRDKEKAAIEQANHDTIEQARVIATPDNHQATILIRRYYPDFIPTQQMIDGPFIRTGNWWETLETRPSPATCPGEPWAKHPANGSWCQVCGWTSQEGAK